MHICGQKESVRWNIQFASFPGRLDSLDLYVAEVFKKFSPSLSIFILHSNYYDKGNVYIKWSNKYLITIGINKK